MSMNPNPFAGVQNRKTTQPIRRPGRAGHTPLALASALACVVGFTALAPSAHAQTPPSSAADSVQQVYVAFYGRPGDPDGLNYWASRVGAGGVGSILDQFSGSPEASQLFAGMSDEGKITFIYRVLFNRDSDGPGLSYWAGELSSGKRTLQEISFEILKGARNEDMAKIANKVAAANYFSSQIAARNIKADYTVQADIFLARNWLATINETDASLVNAKANIDALLNRISLAGKPQTVTGVLATPAGSARLPAPSSTCPWTTRKTCAARQPRPWRHCLQRAACALACPTATPRCQMPASPRPMPSTSLHRARRRPTTAACSSCPLPPRWRG